MFRQINRLFHSIEDENFEDIFKEGEAILPQIEIFANHNGIELLKGWKVEVAKGVKQQLLKAKASVVPDEYILKWTTLFNRLNT